MILVFPKTARTKLLLPVRVRRRAPAGPRRELRRGAALARRSRRERVRALSGGRDAARGRPRRRAAAARARAAARLAARRLAERAHVGDELQESLLVQLPAEGRHDRLEAERDLGLRVEDGLAYVRLVNRHRAVARDGLLLAEESVEGRPAPLLPARLRLVARGAAALLEELLPPRGRRLRARAAREPLLVGRPLHDDDVPVHPAVVRAAIFGAEELVAAGLGGLDPELRVAPRYNVLLD